MKGNTLMKSLSFLTLLSLVGCSGERPDNLGVSEGSLSACPSSPNCVSSFERDADHKIFPLDAGIEDIKSAILKMERVAVISESENYLHAEFTSKVMGFIDDVEFYYEPASQLTHVRSASRLGKSDLGVNRKRIEAIRFALRYDE